MLNGADSEFETNTAYLGLGSNVGDRSLNIQEAILALGRFERIAVDAISRFYEGEAHVLPGQDPAPDFLNAAVAISTDYTPRELLDHCLEIERSLGRERGRDRWLPRTIDIDILLIDGMTYADDELTVPHPRLHERRFALEPLADIAPEVVVPAPHNRMVKELLSDCADKSVLVIHSETSRVPRPAPRVKPLRQDIKE